MLFFNKPKLIIYLKRNSLEVYKGSEKTADVTYPFGAVRHLEIMDVDAFEKFIFGIFPQGNRGGQKITLVLSSDMVFQKVFPHNPAEEQRQIQNFLEKIPFDPTQLEIKKIANEKDLAVVAITKNLYLPVKRILEKIGFTVETVVPASVLGNVTQDTPLNQKDIWQKVNDSKIITTANFLRS
ncbi:MAG: hypothetical protein WCV81_04235 [Microgenomates group bacterium]|jgi:hypothetical protein